MFLCFYGNVLVTSFTVILWPLDYGTATRGNPGFRVLRTVSGAWWYRARPPDNANFVKMSELLRKLLRTK
jgi:hypothetical protein